MFSSVMPHGDTTMTYPSFVPDSDSFRDTQELIELWAGNDLPPSAGGTLVIEEPYICYGMVSCRIFFLT
jgi:hypothetical protein